MMPFLRVGLAYTQAHDLVASVGLVDRKYSGHRSHNHQQIPPSPVQGLRTLGRPDVSRPL